jgi:hypothetical protein
LVERYQELEWIVKSAQPIDVAANRLPNHPRVRVIHVPDSGIYEAMNQAVRLASGEYLVFLGAGDELLGNKLPFLLRVLTDGPGLGSPLLFFAAQMESWRRVWCPDPSDFDQRMSSPHGAMLMKKSSVENVGGFDERYRIAGDYDLTSRILKASPSCMLWQSTEAISYCASGGISVRNFLEAFLEECLIRLRVWGHGHLTVGSDIERYLEKPFRLLLSRDK